MPACYTINFVHYTFIKYMTLSQQTYYLLQFSTDARLLRMLAQGMFFAQMNLPKTGMKFFYSCFPVASLNFSTGWFDLFFCANSI
jgi:hypothetical protein